MILTFRNVRRVKRFYHGCQDVWINIAVIVSEMSDSSSSNEMESVDIASDAPRIFELVFGTVIDTQYYISPDGERYAVVVEEGDTCHLTIVYNVEPVVRLLWVFRSVDSALWGDAMWADNEHVIDVAEVIGEETEALLVTENVNGIYMLKFLTHDVDVDEWRVYLILHEDGREDYHSVLDESSYDIESSEEPPLEDDSTFGP